LQIYTKIFGTVIESAGLGSGKSYIILNGGEILYPNKQLSGGNYMGERFCIPICNNLEETTWGRDFVSQYATIWRKLHGGILNGGDTKRKNLH
jgi:hypothetical protein